MILGFLGCFDDISIDFLFGGLAKKLFASIFAELFRFNWFIFSIWRWLYAQATSCRIFSPDLYIYDFKGRLLQVYHNLFAHF